MNDDMTMNVILDQKARGVLLLRNVFGANDGLMNYGIPNGYEWILAPIACIPDLHVTLALITIKNMQVQLVAGVNIDTRWYCKMEKEIIAYDGKELDTLLSEALKEAVFWVRDRMFAK